jgi:hypothetical protein
MDKRKLVIEKESYLELFYKYSEEIHNNHSK